MRLVSTSLLASLAVALLGVVACGGSSGSADLSTTPPAASDAGAPSSPSSSPSSSPPAPLADAGSDSGTNTAGIYFPPPGDAWDTIDAAAAGFDSAKLDALATFVEQSHSTTFIILYDGRIVSEKYWGGATASTAEDIASAQKSVLSMLVGIVRAKKGFSLDDTVTSVAGGAGWSNATPEQEAPITVRQLLTMTSGLDEQLAYAAPPGTTWLYNTNGYHRLELVIQTQSGMTLDAATHAAIFDPIGVSAASIWSSRPNMKDAKGNPTNALKMTARDMARVGLLIMADGTWNGSALVPSDYLASALTTSQSFNPSYGFLFWLNGQSSALLPPSVPKAGALIPHAPADVIAALGANDQKIYVGRTEHLVVIRQGASAAAGGLALSDWDDQLWQQIMAAKLP